MADLNDCFAAVVGRLTIAEAIERFVLGLDCVVAGEDVPMACLLYTSPSPRDISGSRMPSSA